MRRRDRFSISVRRQHVRTTCNLMPGDAAAGSGCDGLSVCAACRSTVLPFHAPGITTPPPSGQAPVSRVKRQRDADAAHRGKAESLCHTPRRLNAYRGCQSTVSSKCPFFGRQKGAQQTVGRLSRPCCGEMIRWHEKRCDVARVATLTRQRGRTLTELRDGEGGKVNGC